MPPTDTPTPERALAEMTLEELRAEREMWNARVLGAECWGASLIFAAKQRDAYDREIARRSADA